MLMNLKSKYMSCIVSVIIHISHRYRKKDEDEDSGDSSDDDNSEGSIKDQGETQT